jgi:hypothetical protein
MFGLKLLASDNSGLKLDNWAKVFKHRASFAAKIDLVTGYISSESILVVLEFLKSKNQIREFNLVVGMAKQDGLSQMQISALEMLDAYLSKKRLGSVYIAWAKPVHAKITIFYDDGVMLGSSNLSAFISSGSPFEVDVFIDDLKFLKSSEIVVSDIISSAKKLQDVKHKIPVSKEKLSQQALADRGVSKWDFPLVKYSPSGPSFELELRPTAKSNLNACFAAPKNTGAGPRNWFEVEIIISTKVSAHSLFPSHTLRNKPFEVLTDDGYRFTCHFSGSNFKNLTSKDDLTILGAWIKGRLIDAGALNFGGTYTELVATKYGRSSVTLTATKDKNLWLLSYNV